jgi:hypothetical protein
MMGQGNGRWIGRIAVLLAVGMPALTPVRADVFTPLASYEPSESGLSVTPNPGDAGLSLSIVQGGVSGVPAATDGSYVLRLEITNETDGKVELRHDWSLTTYDLAGQDELLLDVYIASAGALPGLMGVWSPNWNPPDNWQPASSLPTGAGSWDTVSLNVADRSQVGLDNIWALVFENLASANGTIYVDNLRFRQAGPAPDLTGFGVLALAERNELRWKGISDPNLDGYNVYRATAAGGPFTQLNATPLGATAYVDAVGAGAPEYFYYVAAQISGADASVTDVHAAQYNGLTDAVLMDLVQQRTFRYFWDGGHPVCGMAREGLNMGHPLDTVTTGGTGMGLMTLVVGAERGFKTRAAIADRVLTILAFLEDVTPRYHGAWSHHYHGVTGATIPFAGFKDNGGDIVETAFLVEGILTARQYFDDPVDPVETEIRTRATRMWEDVEWDWYRRFPGSNVLYWHWSPDYGWDLNLLVRGYNEAMMVYLLAVASPTYPMPAAAYHTGWVGGGYVNGNSYYGIPQWVGEPLGGPLFFTHYSNLGFDPRYKRDAYANYFENARNISLIHQAFAMDNPNGFADYGELVWGFTASFNPTGYSAHSPTNDNGTITPTAAVSAIPYTPQPSLATMRYFYDHYGTDLFGVNGFVDAFNPEASWFAPGYIAIDQGTIVPMIENYRTGLCWRLFMSNPEIRPMMTAIGMFFEVDFDQDGDVDVADHAVFADCVGGPDNATAPGGCAAPDFTDADLDNDGDVDLHDAAIFQQLFDSP